MRHADGLPYNLILGTKGTGSLPTTGCIAKMKWGKSWYHFRG